MNRAARLGTALGPAIALWAVTPLLLERSAPHSPWMLLVLLAVAGLIAQIAFRIVSNRWWFAGMRTRTALQVAALGLAATLSSILCAIAVLGHVMSGGGAGEVDRAMLGASWFTMSMLLVLAFRGRVEFRGWVLFHNEVSERTRPFATAPLGPDRAAVHDFIDDLIAHADARGSIEKADAHKAAQWIRLASDDRYRRAVPWSTARRLLETFIDHVDSVSPARVALDATTGSDDVRVVLQPVCDVIQELSLHSAVGDVKVTSAAGAGEKLLLIITCSLIPDRVSDPTVDPATARSLQPFSVTVARPSPDILVCTTEFASTRRDQQEEALEAFLTAPAELIAVSPFSAGARSVYRRGNAVIKLQRHGWIDPKTTLLEDEFHLLRRLQGRSSRFPNAIGYGIESTFSWIAYEYVEGEPLDAWLRTNRDHATHRLLSFGVDLHEMLGQLTACRVAHRDLNPGNLIVQQTGGLVLIDFDQAASGSQFVNADLRGVDDGLAKNDLVEFLETARLTRAANELLKGLEDAWPSANVPFSLGVLGHRFGQGWHLDPLLDTVRRRLHPIGETRVLDLCSKAPVAGLLLASAGAMVTAVVDSPKRWERLGRLVGPRFEMVTDPSHIGGTFDLTWAVGSDSPALTSVGGPVIVERTGRHGEPSTAETWLLTTALTHLGT
jgi:predicted Ser/Thr protein kinase